MIRALDAAELEDLRSYEVHTSASEHLACAFGRPVFDQSTHMRERNPYRILCADGTFWSKKSTCLFQQMNFLEKNILSALSTL